VITFYAEIQDFNEACCAPTFSFEYDKVFDKNDKPGTRHLDSLVVYDHNANISFISPAFLGLCTM
jgi:hypothetical protein